MNANQLFHRKTTTKLQPHITVLFAFVCLISSVNTLYCPIDHTVSTYEKTLLGLNGDHIQVPFGYFRYAALIPSCEGLIAWVKYGLNKNIKDIFMPVLCRDSTGLCSNDSSN